MLFTRPASGVGGLTLPLWPVASWLLELDGEQWARGRAAWHRVASVSIRLISILMHTYISIASELIIHTSNGHSGRGRFRQHNAFCCGNLRGGSAACMRRQTGIQGRLNFTFVVPLSKCPPLFALTSGRLDARPPRSPSEHRTLSRYKGGVMSARVAPGTYHRDDEAMPGARPRQRLARRRTWMPRTGRCVHIVVQEVQHTRAGRGSSGMAGAAERGQASRV